MSRIFALATITFLEGIRNRSAFGILLFSLFILGLNITVAGFFMRDIGKVCSDMNLSAISFAGLLLVLFVGINLIAKDIDKKTIHLVLSKPISRVEYIWGKYIGILFFIISSLVFLIIISAGVMLSLNIVYNNYFGQFSWLNFFIACFFILVKLSVLGAVAIFFSSITTSSFVTLIFSICTYIAGVSIEEVIFYLRSHLAEGDLTTSIALQKTINIITYVVPNFSVFDFKIEAAYGLAIGWHRIGISLGYGLAYSALLLIFSSIIFQRREFH